MQYADFINQVNEQMEAGTYEDAVSLTRATLETLGERIYRTARSDLASQLPDELKDYLKARVVPETSPRQVDRFPLTEFYQRVSARANISLPQAVRGAQTVMTVLRSAVSAGEWEDLSAELPAEYGEILSEEAQDV